MSKIKSIDNYIEQCNTSNLSTLREDTVNTIISVFNIEIPNIDDGLTASLNTKTYKYVSTDLFADITLLKAKLENYKLNLQREDIIRTDKLKQLELQRQIISITNTNQNENASSSNASATAFLTFTISQTIENINKLPESLLSKEDSVELKELIYSIEGMISAKDTDGIKSKITKVLGTVANKGFDLFVAVAPYLLQASSFIPTA
ncbi:hypothetical protein [Acetobacterium sp.]|uniref:hypothetical protein n=1 Tax=Acetobacterium sp. TaxID=1872094 RepID=UPI002F4157EF